MSSIKDNIKSSLNIDLLRTALQYADNALNIDVETASYQEICEALAAQYPDQLILFDPDTGATEITGGFNGSGSTVTSSLITMAASDSAAAANASYSCNCYSRNQIYVPLSATKINFDIPYLRMISYNGTYGGSARGNLYFGLYSGGAWIDGAYNSSYASSDAQSSTTDLTWTNQHASITLPDSVKGNPYIVGFAANGHCYNGPVSINMQCNKIWFSYE